MSNYADKEQLVRDIEQLKGSVRGLMGLSEIHQTKINTAKTQTKKEYYLKKLRKNNSELANGLIALRMYEKLLDKAENPTTLKVPPNPGKTAPHSEDSIVEYALAHDHSQCGGH